MRMLMIVSLHHETFNEAVKDGSAGLKMNAILKEVKPDAVYFTEMNGQRTAVIIVEMERVSMIPSLVEPWFLTFNADVEVHPVMIGQDLEEAGLAELGKKWG